MTLLFLEGCEKPPAAGGAGLRPAGRTAVIAESVSSWSHHQVAGGETTDPAPLTPSKGLGHVARPRAVAAAAARPTSYRVPASPAAGSRPSTAAHRRSSATPKPVRFLPSCPVPSISGK